MIIKFKKIINENVIFLNKYSNSMINAKTD